MCTLDGTQRGTTNMKPTGAATDSEFSPASLILNRMPQRVRNANLGVSIATTPLSAVKDPTQQTFA